MTTLLCAVCSLLVASPSQIKVLSPSYKVSRESKSSLLVRSPTRIKVDMVYAYVSDTRHQNSQRPVVDVHILEQ
jgi:hypothetical protein